MKLPIQMFDPTRDYQNHKEEYDNSIQKVLNHGQFINGQEIKELEDKLSKYINVKYCITMSNGTDAIKIALLALNIGYGDEVITVSHTWISTAEVISLIGAKPVFVDIDPINFNIDINKIEEKITKNTKAILPVSLYGLMPDYKKINEIANKYNISVIEDGAQSFGSIREDYKSCSCMFTTIATTSFFPSKPYSCYGDGGACFTNDDNLALKLRAIKNHGGLERFKHKYIGMNARLDTIQAGILLVKLNYLDKSLELRNKVANYYKQNLQELENKNLVKLPIVPNENYHVWAQFSILINNKIIRDNLFNYLKNNNVNVAIFYPSPLHTQECFSYLNYKYGSFPITETICESIINLPCYAELTLEELEYIVGIFKNFFSTQP